MLRACNSGGSICYLGIVIPLAVVIQPALLSAAEASSVIAFEALGCAALIIPASAGAQGGLASATDCALGRNAELFAAIIRFIVAIMDRLRPLTRVWDVFAAADGRCFSNSPGVQFWRPACTVTSKLNGTCRLALPVFSAPVCRHAAFQV